MEDHQTTVNWHDVWDEIMASPPMEDLPIGVECNHAARIRAANEELERKIKASVEAMHESEVNCAWWDGVVCAVCTIIAGVVLTAILRAWL
jgi:hypothetical protein